MKLSPILFLIWMALLPMAGWAQLLTPTQLKNAEVYTDLEEALEEPEKVYVLRLKSKKLSALPEEVRQFKNLNRIVLTRNRFTVFPVNLREFPFLQEVDISRNKIDSIPPGIADLTNLRRLYLGHNLLEELPAEIAQLSELRELDLWGNLLSTIPLELAKSPKLKTINLKVMDISQDEQNKLRENFGEIDLKLDPACNCQ